MFLSLDLTSSRAYSDRVGLRQALLKLIWTALQCACGLAVQNTGRCTQKVTKESDAWFGAVVWYSMKMYWIGWDGMGWP